MNCQTITIRLPSNEMGEKLKQEAAKRGVSVNKLMVSYIKRITK